MRVSEIVGAGEGVCNIFQGLSNITVPLPLSFHSIFQSSVTITVDNETVSTLLPSPPPTLTTDNLLVVGGINDTSSVLVAERFRGCFDSLILNER